MKAARMKIILKLDVIISFTLLVLISLMVIVHVAFRLIGRPIYGAEELERYLFVTMVFLSLSFITRSDNHIRFDSLLLKLPKFAQSIVEILINILSTFVFGVTTYSGIIVVMSNTNVKTASLGIPFLLISIPVLLGFFLMTITYIYKTISSTKDVIYITNQNKKA